MAEAVREAVFMSPGRHPVEGIHEVRRTRTGSSIINPSVRVGKAAPRMQLHESAVSLRVRG